MSDKQLISDFISPAEFDGESGRGMHGTNKLSNKRKLPSFQEGFSSIK